MASVEEMEQLNRLIKESRNTDCCGGGSCGPKEETEEENTHGLSTKQKIIGMFFLIFCSGGLIPLAFSAYDSFNESYSKLDINHSDSLKQILYGGSPHLILCDYPSNPYNKNNKSSLKKAAGAVYTNLGLSTYGIDCEAKLPKTGKTIVETLRLPESILAFTVANGASARPIGSQMLTDIEKLPKFIEGNITPRAPQLQKPSDFESICLSRKKCIVASNRGIVKKDFIDKFLIPAVSKHRSVRAVTVDRSKFLLRPSEEILGTRSEKNSSSAKNDADTLEIICFSAVSNETGPDAVFGSFFTGDLNDPVSVEAFVGECQSAPVSLEASVASSLVRAQSRPSMIHRPPQSTTPKPTTTTSTTTTTTTTKPAPNKSENEWSDFVELVQDEL